MGYSPFNNIKMNEQEKINKITELGSIIVSLKTANQNIHTKKTIQKLQQEIDKLKYE